MDNGIDQQSLIDNIRIQLRDLVRGDGMQQRTSNDIISNNAKIVIFALFGLIFASIIMYSALITGKFNPDSSFGGISISGNSFESLEQKMYNDIIGNQSLTDLQKIGKIQELNDLKINNFQERFQQIEQLDAVFIAAISGAIALGGTLISQIWGRRQQ
jgi:hypothetical protein